MTTLDAALAEIPPPWYLSHLGMDNFGCGHLPPWSVTLRDPSPPARIVRGLGNDPYLAIFDAIGRIPEAEPEPTITYYSGRTIAEPSALDDLRSRLLARSPASPIIKRRSL